MIQYGWMGQVQGRNLIITTSGLGLRWRRISGLTIVKETWEHRTSLGGSGVIRSKHRVRHIQLLHQHIECSDYVSVLSIVTKLIDAGLRT